MANKYKIVAGEDFQDWIKLFAEAVGEDVTRTKRIIIDVSLDEVVYIYVEKIGDERLLDLKPPKGVPVNLTIGE